jgi:hypothetical protein
MRRQTRKTIVVAIAVFAATLIACQVAHLQMQLPIARCPIQVTPQAVILGEATSGTTKTASVVVTNVSKEDVHVTVQAHKDWLRVSPAQMDLGPGSSGKINMVGTLDSLAPRVQFADPPGGSSGARPPKPVTDADVVWICGGQVCTPVVVFAVKMTPQQ